jgi:hypothetical protein
MTAQIARRPFTVTDYARMRETGILKEDDRVELIDGEVRLMSLLARCMLLSSIGSLPSSAVTLEIP